MKWPFGDPLDPAVSEKLRSSGTQAKLFHDNAVVGLWGSLFVFAMDAVARFPDVSGAIFARLFYVALLLSSIYRLSTDYLKIK